MIWMYINFLSQNFYYKIIWYVIWHLNIDTKPLDKMLYKELCTNKYLVLILNINILENISENITSLINCAFFYEYSLYISDLLVSIL